MQTMGLHGGKTPLPELKCMTDLPGSYLYCSTAVAATEIEATSYRYTLLLRAAPSDFLAACDWFGSMGAFVLICTCLQWQRRS